MPNQPSHIIFGLGQTGLSVAQFLVKEGFNPFLIDTKLASFVRGIQAQFPHLDYCLGHVPIDTLCKAQQIILNPGVSLQRADIQQAKQAGAEVIGDIELFARAIHHSDAQVIGITGSNGKSTVTTLVGDILKAAGLKYAIGGNIGIPALSILDPHIDIYVLELSSFQLETTSSLNCAISTVLNLSEDHLDRYASFSDYTHAKQKILQQTRIQLITPDLQIHDCHSTQQHLTLNPHDISSDWYITDGNIYYNKQPICSLKQAKLLGAHHQSNYLAAAALSYAVGADSKSIAHAISQFTGLEHRFEWTREHQGVCYINDSKATNVGATVAALKGLKQQYTHITLIAGGDAKEADLSSLQPYLKEVDCLICLGKDAYRLSALKPNSLSVHTMDQAVQLASQKTISGGIVLLSPACASLDMYPNFMARGQHFKDCVAQL